MLRIFSIRHLENTTQITQMCKESKEPIFVTKNGDGGNSVPEYKMGYVLAYLQGLTADEEADNAYCEQLYQDYLNNPDPDKHQTISLEELCEREGVEL